MGFDIGKVSFSLIGYGNVGSWTGRLLSQRGAKMKAVLDHTGGVAYAEVHFKTLTKKADG